MRPSQESVSLAQAMWRGFRMRCPHCGQGTLFGRFLKVADHCPKCDEELSHHCADDFPAYLVIEFSFPAFSSPRDRFMKPWIGLGPGAGVSRRRIRAFQVAIAGRRWLLWSAATMRVRSV